MSRTATVSRALLSLVLAVTIAAVALRCAGWLFDEPCQALGLDFWNIPAYLKKQADSLARMEEQNRISETLTAARARRELVFQAVLERRQTLSAGLVEIRGLLEETPTLRPSFRLAYPGQPWPQAVRNFYRTHWETRARNFPDAVRPLLPELAEFFGDEWPASLRPGLTPRQTTQAVPVR